MCWQLVANTCLTDARTGCLGFFQALCDYRQIVTLVVPCLSIWAMQSDVAILRANNIELQLPAQEFH